jgi:hypothetical protein
MKTITFLDKVCFYIIFVCILLLIINSKKIKMKQLLKLMMPIFIGLLVVTCGKDEKEPEPDVELPGLWTGFYGRLSEPQNLYYAMLFRADGTVRVFSAGSDTTGSNKAEGIYSVSGSVVTTTYTYISGISGTFSTSATLGNSNTKLAGTYGSGEAVSGGGTFTINK